MSAATAEAPQVTMQLVKNGDSVALDMEPPASDDQRRLVEAVLASYGVSADTPLFRDVTPRGTKPFTEIDCTAAQTEAEKEGLSLDERQFAQEVGDLLVQNGNVVVFDSTEIVPVERSHRLLNLQPRA